MIKQKLYSCTNTIVIVFVQDLLKSFPVKLQSRLTACMGAVFCFLTMFHSYSELSELMTD